MIFEDESICLGVGLGKASLSREGFPRVAWSKGGATIILYLSYAASNARWILLLRLFLLLQSHEHSFGRDGQLVYPNASRVVDSI